ncbi:hypothetical protein FALBO_10392 [Fusarium albosuccineum]|uniref:Uncharacterized protein n=1 Tax=Fusarium albosuccineum TaxID=1237068 RepID=A0A8H4P859_9HYPO|nr:hypothetical protein FALBO_10392 [Fusarium albosuccineum]
MSATADDPGGRKKFNEENMEKLKRSDKKQQQLRERVSKTGKLTLEQKSAWDTNSNEALKNFWQTTFNAKVDFDAEHEHGAGRFSKTATSLAATAYDFLRDLSPIVEIVKDFGAPFGSMAIGTVCLLFAVAKNRANMEEKIESTLKDIKDRLPGMSMYQHIYNDNHELDRLLQSQIVDAYESFMDYCVAALDFYTQRSSYRLIRVFKSQSSLDQQAQLVQDAVVRVRLVCEEVLGKNVNIIREKLEEVLITNVALLDENDLKSLGQICTHLGIESFSSEDHFDQLQRHKGNVAAYFWSKTWLGEQESDQQLGRVLSDPGYQEWLVSESSGVFILSGENDFNGASHCWASPVALNLIDQLTKDGNEASDTCVFYLLGHQEHDDTCLRVLTSLVFQLLKSNKEALRDKAQLDELLAKLTRYSRLPRSPSEENSKQDSLAEVVLRAVKMIPADKTIWVVLDRVDKCCDQLQADSPGGRRPRKGARTLLRTLGSLTRGMATKVKILAVVNRADWRIEQEGDEVGVEEGRVVIRRFSQGGGFTETL